MAKNFPGPYEIEINYSVAGLNHKQRLNCDVASTPIPGDDPSSIDLITRSGVTVNLLIAINEWVNLIADRFNATEATINDFSFYRYTPNTFDRFFITTQTLGVPGNRSEPTNLANQEQYTFRSQEGGVLRINLLETIALQRGVTPYGLLQGTNKVLADYVLRPDTWILCRDTSYPIAGINGNFGENESTFRRRFR